jgi:hypothetical protein
MKNLKPSRDPATRTWLMAIGCFTAFALVCAPAKPIGACSCASIVGETVSLELVSVTRDGAPVSSLAPWSEWNVTLVAANYRSSDPTSDVTLSASRDGQNHTRSYANVP